MDIRPQTAMSDMSIKIRLIDKALAALSPLEGDCVLCPRRCRIDRRSGRAGICRTGVRAAVSHALLHFGEEPVLSGHPGSGAGARAGSGTVFFTGCNLKCLFCQNYQLSWLLEGREVDDAELADMMLDLQRQGALNINLVSPTHVILPILRALRRAYEKGLALPVVYNSNGFDSLDVIRALDGIVDVYLPDLKYHSSRLSEKYSAAPDYFEHASEAVREMSLQQPVLALDPEGAARRGLIIRHLVLPGGSADSLAVLGWIRDNLSPHIGLSLMSQYHPCFRAPGELQRGLTADEYAPAAHTARGMGLAHVFLQPEPFGADEHLVPDFRKKKPFRWK
jgi:putative pyruvate formate lyase activating enzyme